MIEKKRLSKRLSAAASLVSGGGVLCDVGCDHANLPIALVLSGRIRRAIAMDISEGPLEKAFFNISEAGLCDKIETRLSDGLYALNKNEADTIVIAGMGGRLIRDILKKGIEIADTASEWILSPQSEASLLRFFIRDSGAMITDEDMVCERGKYYPIIKAVPGRASFGKRVYDAYGPVLIKNRHPLLLEYLQKEKKRLSSIISRTSDKDDKSAVRARDEYGLVLEALSVMEDV